MKKITYKDAGVDPKEGEKAVSLMHKYVEKTFDSNVLTGLGGFGGLYELGLKGIKTPVLVSGTDGVGTKLKIAFMTDRHDTIGQDCVAMCVNDILCQGARPLFFLDYIATGGVKAEKIAEIVKGIAAACELAGCSLIGGETAEMPGLYDENEYDLAGFAVGLADKDKLITGQNIEAGDKIVGLTSSGIHSNGYSLVRKLFFDELGMSIDSRIFNEIQGDKKDDRTLGEILLEPTKIYTDPIMRILENKRDAVHGIIHITGGGYFENIPRIMPDGLGVAIDRSAWPKPWIFEYMSEYIDEKEMFSTFNMGIGMMLIVSEKESSDVLELIQDEAYIIGEITREEGVRL